MKNLILVIIIISSSMYGQQKIDPASETTWNLLKFDAGSIFGGMGYAYSRPLHWQGNQWLTFGGVAAVTVALYLFDKESSEFFRNQKEDVPKAIRDYGYKVR